MFICSNLSSLQCVERSLITLVKIYFQLHTSKIFGKKQHLLISNASKYVEIQTNVFGYHISQ